MRNTSRRRPSGRRRQAALAWLAIAGLLAGPVAPTVGAAANGQVRAFFFVVVSPGPEMERQCSV